ncbi:MAG: AbrB/MazE/SpoVT family DNA-binding domain-containing protein [Rhizomicrobium sp.]
MATTVTSKGQVTIPKRVRDALGIAPGSSVEFELAEDGRAFVRPGPKTDDFQNRLEKARAKFKSLGMTTDEYLDGTRQRRK